MCKTTIFAVVLQASKQCHTPDHFRRISVQYRSMNIVPVPISNYNYAYLLIDESTNKAATIDPYDVSKVSAAADAVSR